MSVWLSQFLTAFPSLLAIVDPLGTASAFAAFEFSGPCPRAQARRTALRGTLLAIAILCAASLAAPFVLRAAWLFAALRVAGGLALLASAWPMLRAEAKPPRLSSDPALFPLAVPLLAGPGCISTVALFAVDAAKEAQLSVVIAAVLAVQALAFICLLGVTSLRRWLKTSLLRTALRASGIWLSLLGLSALKNGLGALLLIARNTP